jgi:hypothetical protein
LQPSGHGNIVGIDAQLTIRELALEIENLPGAPGEKVMRQKLASVVLGAPSVALSRINGFSPVKMTALGSTVGMISSF